MKNNIGIYKITSPKNKVYIGQTINFGKRIKQYKNLDCKLQTRIYNSLKKYGSELHNFELIEVCELHLLNERERYWQDFYDCTGIMGLNCRLTVSSDKSGKLSKKTKENMCGRVVSQETRKKISDALTGKKHSQERIEQNRINRIGFKQSIESREKISKSLMGKKKSPTHIANMMKYAKFRNLGRKQSIETKEKMSINSGSAKLVLNTQTGIFYDSCKSAAESTSHMSKGFLNKKLSGWNKNKTDFIYV